MKVYTVTMLDLVSDPVLGTRRTPVIFTSLEKAISAVKNNEDDLTDDNLYQYAVIEETLLDVIRPDLIYDVRKLWFKYNMASKEFEFCPLDNLPKALIKLSGFGIG